MENQNPQKDINEFGNTIFDELFEEMKNNENIKNIEDNKEEVVLINGPVRVVSSVDASIEQTDWDFFGKIALVGTAIAGIGYAICSALKSDD